MRDDDVYRDTSFAFQPVDVLPAPSSTDAVKVTHLDLTGVYFVLLSIAHLMCFDLAISSPSIECEVQDVTNLRAYKNLNTLIVDKNNLTSLEIFPAIESLQTLCCNNNEIEDLVQFMDEVSVKFKNLRYLSMMRNPACPSLMSIEGTYHFISYRVIFRNTHFHQIVKEPDVEANRLFRLYVLYRLPQLQIIDYEAVTDKERMEAEIRGQFAVKLRRVPKQQMEQQQKHCDVYSKNCEYREDNESSYGGFQASMTKKNQEIKAPSKPSEGNRFISNQQL